MKHKKRDALVKNVRANALATASRINLTGSRYKTTVDLIDLHHNVLDFICLCALFTVRRQLDVSASTLFSLAVKH